MNQFKKCNVHLLPTTNLEIGMIGKTIAPINNIPINQLFIVETELGHYTKEDLMDGMPNYIGFEMQHIYIAVDKNLTKELPVEVGDYYLVELFDITGKSKGLHLEACEKIENGVVNNFDITKDRNLESCMKIVASDNKTLKLGRPSKKFIRKYAELNGKGMSEILLEFTTDAGGWPYDGEGRKAKLIPKLAPDKTVAIRPKKNMYNKKEVMEFVKRFSSENFHEFTSKHQQWLEAML